MSQEGALYFLQRFLQHCRELVVNYSSNNFPLWIQKSSVRYGYINESLIAIFDDGVNNDEYSYLGRIESDVVAIFNMENFVPTTTILRIPNGEGLIIMEGEISRQGGAVMLLRDEYPLFLNCGHHGHHSPVILANLFFQYHPPSHYGLGPKSSRFIPFALYIHRLDMDDTNLWIRLDVHLVPHFIHIHSDLGSFYRERQGIRYTFAVTVESTVITFGRDSEESTLNQMRE